MKYTEMNINQKTYGKKYMVYDWKENDKENRIYVKSQTHTGECPKCGRISSQYHGTYTRKIQSVPIKLKTTYIEITTYKYKCENEECEQKVFKEELDFATGRQVRTGELTSLILAVSIFLSSEGASKMLRLMGIKVSGDTIKRIYDRIMINNYEDIEAVGIDDVAIRKGQRYATAVYDLNDHHMIALFAGRGAEELKEWLKSHRKIKTVARDRASGYAAAINEILPDCVQIADRFHLLAGLIDRMKDIFNENMPSEIFTRDGVILNEQPEKVEMLKISPESKRLEQYHYDNEVRIDGNGNPVEYDKKSRNLNDERHKKHAEGRKKNKN